MKKFIYVGLTTILLMSTSSCKRFYSCNCHVDIPNTSLSYDTTYNMGKKDKNEATASCSIIQSDFQTGLDQNPSTQGATVSCSKVEQ
jgi:hypothetical protein